jgi:hypothetical protein
MIPPITLVFCQIRLSLLLKSLWYKPAILIMAEEHAKA